LDAFVLGAGGQLGMEMVRELECRGYQVLALTRRHLNITDQSEFEAFMERSRPRWTINCAAYNKVDLAESEPEKAMAVNGFAVRGLAQVCQRFGSTLLHYSTDHVFDGLDEQPDTEEDPPAPPSAYGVSKLAGERFARDHCDNAYVVRVAGVFGPAGVVTSHGNFPELIYQRTSAGQPLRIVDDYFSTPTYAPALASRSVDLLQKAEPGLYHLGGGETISWYEWARKIAAVAGLAEELISPVGHVDYPTPAKRPQHASLSNAKAEALGIAAMPSLDEAAAEWLELRNKIAAAQKS
jgi:dTDP-4-dehydrorhamnose reductase